MAPSVSSVNTNHGTLSIRSWAGQGREAVLIHGVDGSGAAFEDVAADVAGTRTLTAVDLRGRGSSSVDGPWGVGAHAADLISLLEQRPGPVTLVGHSFGGHVASLVAATRPALVEHLVLVDGGPRRVIPDDKTPLSMAEFVGQNIWPNLAEQPNHPLTQVALQSDLASMMTDGSAELVTGVPISLVRAGNGVAPGLPPIVPDSTAAALGVTHDILVPDATHFSLLSEHRSAVVELLNLEIVEN